MLSAGWARDVSAREAALLAAVLPNPHRRSGPSAGPAVRRLAGVLEARAAAPMCRVYAPR